VRFIEWKTGKEPVEGKLFQNEFVYEGMEADVNAFGKGSKAPLERNEHRFVKPSEQKSIRDSEFSRMSQSHQQR